MRFPGRRGKPHQACVAYPLKPELDESGDFYHVTFKNCSLYWGRTVFCLDVYVKGVDGDIITPEGAAEEALDVFEKHRTTGWIDW